MALKTAYEGATDVVVTGTMSGGAASDWIDLPVDPPVYAIHAICTAAAKWQIGGTGKTLVRDMVLSTHIVTPTASNAGFILYDAIPGGGASIRLFDTSSSSNVWTVWLKYHSKDMP